MTNQLSNRRSFLKAGLAVAVAAPALTKLRGRVHGVVAVPGDPHYDEGRAAWNLSVDQRPALTVMAEGEDDIVAAVNYAREKGLGVAVQSTGHGVTVPANGGVLIQTGKMRKVQIDAARRMATTEPGVIWGDVLPQTQEVGLAPLSGSSSGVGVAGYTLGGGSGWLGRKYGYAADHVVAARMVLADGHVVRVSADEHPDLFWGLRGGTSNFGIMTELQFRVFPDSMVYGGGLYWPVARASEVAKVFREFTATAPESVTSRLTLVHVPPLPNIPKELHFQWLVAVQGVFSGTEDEGKALFAPFRRLGGTVEDALGMMPMAAADSVAREPLEPIPGVVHTELLDEISPEMIRYFVEEVARPDSQVMILEMRHQGGAFGRAPESPNAVGHRAQGFWFNAIGAAMPPRGREGAEADLRAVRSAMKKYASGKVFLNGIEEFGADRVRDAYAHEVWWKLGKLKRTYDPANLFRLNRNIPPVAA